MLMLRCASQQSSDHVSNASAEPLSASPESPDVAPASILSFTGRSSLKPVASCVRCPPHPTSVSSAVPAAATNAVRESTVSLIIVPFPFFITMSRNTSGIDSHITRLTLLTRQLRPAKTGFKTIACTDHIARTVDPGLVGHHRDLDIGAVGSGVMVDPANGIGIRGGARPHARAGKLAALAAIFAAC